MSKAKSKVFLADGDDPEMHQACETARANFRYFWREVAADRRRIIPALGLACVKAPFSDGESENSRTTAPKVEHMWLDEVDFDGRVITGVLLNRPNRLKSVEQGDAVGLALGEISDWMFAISGIVYGAYTVNLLRSRMGVRELKEHDDAWRLNFGDPLKVRLVSEREVRAVSDAFAESLREHLARKPDLVSTTSDNGWTLLHQDALAGNAASVKILLEAGADPNAVTDHGMTPRQLAESLGWDGVIALFRDE